MKHIELSQSLKEIKYKDCQYSILSSEGAITVSMSDCECIFRKSMLCHVDICLHYEANLASLFIKLTFVINGGQQHATDLILFAVILSWFVSKQAMNDVLDGKLIDETEVECIPEKIPDSVLD